jgi:dihydropyrimidinase
MSTILITGGTVVNATGTARADVLVDGEAIAAVLAPGSQLLGIDLAGSVDTVIDASGKLVIPGGIDAHTHMELPFGGTNASDTFETGTRAAAWGGTTSIIDFAVQRYGERVEDGLAAWHAKAAGNCAVDYGFHQIIGGVDEFSLKAMDSLIDEGITSFKLFMAYPGVFYSDDAQILKAMQKSAETGLMTMMHAENGPAIDVLAEQLYSAGKTGPYWHGIARAWQLEEEATHRAIMIADVTGAPLYVVHVSAQQAVAQIAAARDRGRNVFGETCPQYLYLSLEDQLGARSEEWGDFEGAKWVCSTPLRSRAEGHQGALWQALRTNDLQMVSTDHCPFCMKGQKELGRGDFRAIPNGIGSIEHRMDLLYQGVVAGDLTLPRWVEVTSTTPARMFGLYGRKGVIQPGADADIVIYDPDGHTSIGVGEGTYSDQRSSGPTHHMTMDHSAWEGFEVDGHVDQVLSRGTVIVDERGYRGTKGHGRFLKRDLSQYLI